jgi:hypothetical protein
VIDPPPSLVVNFVPIVHAGPLIWRRARSYVDWIKKVKLRTKSQIEPILKLLMRMKTRSSLNSSQRALFEHYFRLAERPLT